MINQLVNDFSLKIAFHYLLDSVGIWNLFTFMQGIYIEDKPSP